MTMIGPIGFTAPWLLLGLIVLPILWLLLRAVPPAPIRRRFPGVALLLGLTDDETQSDKTPWWLLLLRLIALAAVIIGFAGPVLDPQVERGGDGPLLVLIDGTWADARDWPRREDRIAGLLEEAEVAGRPVALVALSDPGAEPLQYQAPDAWARQLSGWGPNPWEPDAQTVTDWIAAQEGDFDTFWLSDGLERGGRFDLLSELESHGTVTVFESPRPIYALGGAVFDDGAIDVSTIRAVEGEANVLTIEAHGLDPAGNQRLLATSEASFDPGQLEAIARFDLPPELRNRITRFQIGGIRSAGAVRLSDDALKRREVALIAGRDDREELELLSPVHYLEQALIPTADLIEGALIDVVPANPDVIALADVAVLAEAEAEALTEWVEAGGMLLRFAGPRLAASDVSRAEEDPLMPVRLRTGGRSVGGAMSWGEAKALAAFDPTSPFFGLRVPDDVSVTAQVLAQPDPTLNDRVIARLTDGTPLVTRKPLGEGQVVLFHVTANAEWSTLPLSGLFVQMLERLAVSTRPARPSAEELEGTTWSPQVVLDAFGVAGDGSALPGITGARLAEGTAGPDMPPGLYAGDDRRVSVNAIAPDRSLDRVVWPDRIAVEGLDVTRATDLKGWLLTVALALLALDALASLWLSGRLRGAGGAAVAALALVLIAPQGAEAQSAAAPQDTAAADALALEATSEVVLAHVLTGDAQVDEIAAAGLLGLSNTLYRRTSIEPARPIAIDIERDEIAFFPFLYWPVTADMPTPSREAYSKLNRYLRSGGMILFDTRDANLAGFGSGSPEGRRLQQLAAPLDVPRLEPIPPDHVLTRTFYLLQEFPGRYPGRDLWVEAAPPDAEQVEGMPFRNLNDGVTPVVIGGNDWAAAWAVSESGAPLLPVGRGTAGERQREFARRFGVNLVMHVLTGNYKSDQVHVPALLDRLGQ